MEEMHVLTLKNIKTSKDLKSIVNTIGVRGKITDRCNGERNACVDVEGVAFALIQVNLVFNPKYVMQLQRDLIMEVGRVTSQQRRPDN